MDWLAIFCAPDTIEDVSRGGIRKCLDENADSAVSTLQPGDSPQVAYCFSFDHSGWSNNAVAYDREWWIRTLGNTAALSGSGMDFEVNAHLLCNRRGNRQTPRDDMPMQACQLGPALFNMEEIDG